MNVIDRAVTALSRVLALAGGAVLLAVIVLVVVSIIGRALIPLGLGPVPGDFELVKLGMAVAVFGFLPWCQLNRGHVSVDLFAPLLGPRRDALAFVLHNMAMTAAGAFITWRLWAGMADKMTYRETTFILRLPVWWGYAVCIPLAAAFTLVAAYTVVRSVREARLASRARQSAGQGAGQGADKA